MKHFRKNAKGELDSNRIETLFPRDLRDCDVDLHWIPYTATCAPCSIEYTAVARLENLSQDLAYIGQLAGMEFENIEVKNPSRGGSSSDLAIEYFREVKKEDVEKLYQLYKIDFQLFGYSPHLYVEAARK